MDFGVLPPEINSARMYAGPGSVPMWSAASAWDGLAAELYAAAASYQSVISRLTCGPWLGPASTSMAVAAAPYVTWTRTTAAQAEHTAANARAAANAYETAYAATVPPPQVAANRSLLKVLAVTNILGQNSPAIAATEADYDRMWAQDATAMYGYAEAALVAATAPRFSEPRQATDPAGQGRQRAAVAKATAQQGAASSSSASSSWDQLKADLQSISKNLNSALQIAYRPISTFQFAIGALNSLTGSGGSATASAIPGLAGAFPGLAGLGGLRGGTSVSAAVGQAGTIGKLSVPPSWAAGPAPTARAAPLPISDISAVPEQPGGLLRGMPLSGAGRRAEGFVNRYGLRHTVMPRPPAAG
ncbi:hypothetical protein A5707_13680 [Mycobacterium kyorinense]|uniref:PPE family protein n=1 Tax=Mycobacterium kyorinense TaxID=487514 RepID=A0A1A2ZR97_9MYCO|nr:PPE family protein [Mycobacterium kyorinense]OBI51591.1 hypothetical protein A5707_13680 [Mycobacterium kyorinense]